MELDNKYVNRTTLAMMEKNPEMDGKTLMTSKQHCCGRPHRDSAHTRTQMNILRTNCIFIFSYKKLKTCNNHIKKKNYMACTENTKGLKLINSVLQFTNPQIQTKGSDWKAETKCDLQLILISGLV